MNACRRRQLGSFFPLLLRTDHTTVDRIKILRSAPQLYKRKGDDQLNIVLLSAVLHLPRLLKCIHPSWFKVMGKLRFVFRALSRACGVRLCAAVRSIRKSAAFSFPSRNGLGILSGNEMLPLLFHQRCFSRRFCTSSGC